ncbi:hypothetical protein LTR56_026002 [Elasticomyces elasticus]|nr:hypothetical protein LTR56_026002 [Elasticomyces elasticus]KAK3621804.1 hypothetical protein LTR22_025043 [Elasticomyces elasticus]KAK4905176.1 hypothetical protein LTR49_025491 [Elasticomyces elasticus]KAK5741966.1 hypothetical protein LTS12_024435 [Elasticomyces elasticus]
MPFTLDPEVGAVLGALFGTDPPKKPAVGDIETRRSNNDAFFGMLNSQRPPVPEVESQDFYTKATDGHKILCRWYTVKDQKLSGSPAVCYAHGGGMISIHIDFYDAIVKRYVKATGVPFLVIDYRLAPEFRAPTQVTDTYAGLEYLITHADELGVDPKRVAIMGDSGGGAIAASMAHYIKRNKGHPVCKQILIYPMIDDRTTTTPESIAPFAVWDGDDNKTAWAAVLGEGRIGSDDVQPTEAAARMTVEDAEGLPPAYIDIGELDLFRDETLEYAKKLGQAGVSCELHVFPNVPHGYDAFAPDSTVSKRAFEERFRTIKSL